MDAYQNQYMTGQSFLYFSDDYSFSLTAGINVVFRNMANDYFNKLLTLSCVGGAEDYCNCFVCLSVGKIAANLRILTLWKYYQQTSNHTRIKINNRLLLKPFCFKVMTIFVTHSRRLTTFRWRLVAKEFTETQLILLEAYRCRITAWNEVQLK